MTDRDNTTTIWALDVLRRYAPPALECAPTPAPRPIDRRQLLSSMQKLDYDMRLRHYANVFEDEQPLDYEQFGEEQQGYHGSDRR